jgi:hypothetical protein
MIPIPIHLPTLLRRRPQAPVYAGRHRQGGTRTPMVDWLTAFNARIAVWLTANTDPDEFEPAAVKAALRTPTQDMPVPYFDSDIGTYRRSGTDSYERLRPRALSAKVGLDRRAIALRRSVPLGPDTDDMWSAA